MTAVLPIATIDTARAHAWRDHLIALGVAAGAILLLFWPDAAHLASVWWNSSTFNHCLLIPPILAWLVWQRLSELQRLQPRAWPPGLLLVGAGAIAWLAGEAGGVALARHLALVLMLQGAVVAILGRKVALGLAFPLLYAFFLVPAGEELVPALQTLTARMAMALLDLAGVPARLAGVFITTPAGYFEVAKACAGVQFLIAMAAFGVLVAHLCFRSWRRRAVFLLAAVTVPILANGVRAFGTIWIAHRAGIEFAVGVDHVFYGGLFFAVVMALLLAAFWPFFDRPANGSPTDSGSLAAPGPRNPHRLAATTAALIGLAALPLAWSSAVASANHGPEPADIVLPDVPGWHRVAGDLSWQPRFAGADYLRVGRYRDSAGREVDLAIALFAEQGEGRELVGHGQGAAGPGWAWTEDAPQPPNGRAERIASHGLVREVATFYRVGGIVTGSGARVKLETMKTRLFGGPRRAVAVLVSAPGAGARTAIDGFLAALGPIGPLGDRVAGLE